MPELAPETVVDHRYRILSRVGSGGMADVFCAEDQQLGRKVALKLLHRRFAEDEEFVERFRREASSAAGLQHPHVVGVYDRGSWDGTSYIAMEYLEGRSLKQLIHDEAPLPAVRAIDLTLQILQAARFAHRRGIIHRDLKPHNVIVDPEDGVKVTDFGIARAGASDMTETGSIMGTAQYLSPEQAQGHGVTPASDLYAVGVILYELLTGRVPFEADSAVSIAVKHVTEAPLPPSRLNPAIAPELDAIVSWALEKEPARRYQDADAFIAALQDVRGLLVATAAGQVTATFGAVAATPPTALAGAQAVEEEPEEELRRRRRWPWILLALVVLAAAAAAAFLLTRPEKVTVPVVVGEDQVLAAQVLRNAGLDPQIDRVTSNRPAGTVIAQSPLGQSRVERGAKVALTVSGGPGQVAVPVVVGLSRKAAGRRLRRAGLKPQVEVRPSRSVPAGQAIDTSPPAGTSILRGSIVALGVSSGTPRITVPDVRGQDRAAAEAELAAKGLVAHVTEQVSDRPPGTVLAQTPDGGVTADSGSTVSLTVAKPSPPVAKPSPQVAVPDEAGHTKDYAVRDLTAKGLRPTVQTKDVDTAQDDGNVLSQSPSGGTNVKKGASVTVVVGRFRAKTTPQPPTTEPSTPTAPTPATP